MRLLVKSVATGKIQLNRQSPYNYKHRVFKYSIVLLHKATIHSFIGTVHYLPPP